MNLFVPSLQKKEIFRALTSLGSTKAPGSDGFSALFNKYWNTVKNVVFHSIWDFFKKNHLLKEQNHTFIALVPKQMGPFFRPISLCNIIYKIISKILANRFKSLLHHFISTLQSAFVPSRNIQDNSILAHELLHSLKLKKKKKGEEDLWLSYQDRYGKSFGFHPILTNWVPICISSPSLSILINDSPFGLFTSAKGLRQGDHLSPFLFILGTKVLSRLFQREEFLVF